MTSSSKSSGAGLVALELLVEDLRKILCNLFLVGLFGGSMGFGMEEAGGLRAFGVGGVMVVFVAVVVVEIGRD